MHQSSLKTLASRVRSALVAFAFASAAAALCLPISTELPPYPIEGAHRIYLHGDTNSAGEMMVSHDLDTTSDTLSIQYSPLGPGTLVADGQTWIASFPKGVVAEFEYDVDLARYEFDVPSWGLGGYLVPASSTTELLGPQDPQGQGPKGGIGSSTPGRIDIWATWPPWLDPYIYTIDFYQFVSVHVRALRANPAGGDPIPEELPPGTTMPTSSNGGANPTPGQLAAGAGTVRVDGSTVNVDSSVGGIPGYTACGGAGGRGSGSISMSDAPQISESGFGPALLQLPNPLEIVGLEIECHFTTYLVVNGQAVWVWHWVWRRVIRFDQGPPYAGGTVLFGPGGPAGGFAADDQAALDNYLGGGFSGAPNQ
jgi:hypothetical protein